MEPNNVPVSVPVPPPAPAVIPASTPQVQQPQPQSGVQYATTWSRILARFIDAVIVSVPILVTGFISGILMALLGAPSPSTNGSISMVISMVVNLIGYGFMIFYYIYFTGSKGQTLGKKAMKIKVVKERDNSVPGYGAAFLREIVGLIFSIGYLWAIWDSKKQGLHDKIAHTIVIKVQPQNL